MTLLGVYDGWGIPGLHWLSVFLLLIFGLVFVFSGLVGAGVSKRMPSKKPEPEKEAKPKEETSNWVEVN